MQQQPSSIAHHSMTSPGASAPATFRLIASSTSAPHTLSSCCASSSCPMSFFRALSLARSRSCGVLGEEAARGERLGERLLERVCSGSRPVGLGDEPNGRCGSTGSGRGFPRASSLPAAHAVILGLGDCCRCRGTLCKRPSASAESLGEAARRRAELERVWLRLRGARLGVLRRSDEFGRGSGQPAACR